MVDEMERERKPGTDAVSAGGADESARARGYDRGPGERGPGLAIAVGLAIGGLLLRLLHVASLAKLPAFTFPYRGLDADLYSGLARRIAGGEIAPDALLHAAPLYAYWLAMFETLAPGNPWAPRLAQAALGALAVFLVARTGERLAGRGAGVLAGLLAALNPLFILYEGTLQSAALVPVFMGAIAFLATGARPRFAAAGFVTGLFVLLRPDALPMLALIAVAIALFHAPLASLRFAVVALIPILPFTILMSARAGGFVPLTAHGGIHLYVGNHAEARGWLSPPAEIEPSPAGFRRDAKRIAERESGRTLTPSEVNRYWSGRARDAIGDEPVRWFRLLVRKGTLFWNEYEIPNNEDLYFLRTRTRGLGLPLPVFGVLAPLGLFGLLFARMRRIDRSVLGAAVVASFAGAVLFFVTGRYRLPAHIPLILLTAAAVPALLDAVRGRRVIPLALLVALIVFCNQPAYRFDETAPLARLADSYAQAGQTEQAEALFREALSIEPDMTEAKLGLAALFEQSGRADEAARLYSQISGGRRVPPSATIRRAAMLAESGDLAAAESLLAALPGQDRTPAAMAVRAGIRMQQGRDAEADALLREALAIDPEDQSALLNAALLAARRNATAEADSLFTALLLLSPNDPRALFNAGSIAARRGDLARAIALWERLARLDPDYPRLAEQLRRARDLRAP